MIRSQKFGCAMLAGVMVLELFLGTACAKNDKNESSQTSLETSQTGADTSVSDTSETTAETTEPEPPVDPVEQQAKETAAELGLPEDYLHGRYDFFIKYADSVKNNPELGEWRAYVLHYFPLVADHLPKEQEEHFLEKVSSLRMISVPIEDAAGDYNSLGNIVRIYSDGNVYGTDAEYTTLLHELTHFMDAFADGEETGGMYYVGGRFAYEDELTAEDWEEYSSSPERTVYETSFITEGGAELYMSKYFGRSPRAYYTECCFLCGFEWIFGSEGLDELFFSKDSTMRFITIMQDAGYTDKEICNVMDSFNFSTYQYRLKRPENMVSYEDVLVDLYTHKKGPNWKDDKVFCRILTLIHNACYTDPVIKHEELNSVFVPNDDMWDWSSSVMDQVDHGTYSIFPDMFFVMIRNDKPYLATRITINDGPEDFQASAIEAEYDFDSGKVLSSEFIAYPIPKTVPAPLPLGKALDDRLSGFIHDNSAMHSQTAFADSGENMTDLYERAAQIGNKYGIKIHVGKDLPEYLERGDVGDAKALKTALDKVENVLSRFPEDLFDQLNYGYYSGFEIVLCNWPLTDELCVYPTKDGYVLHIALECRNQKELDKLEDKLLEAIFSAMDLKLLNYFENFESPTFSEKVWKEKNPSDFSYIGYLNGDHADEMYELYKDYVVSKTAMINAPRERSQLMTALIKSEKLSEPCMNKAEFYCGCIREAFDDSKWPEKTVWEEELSKQMEKTGQKAA